MLVFKTMRSRAVVVALLAVAVAACAEGPTAPPSTDFDASKALFAKGGKGRGPGTRTFTIWPGAAVYERFGDHTLSMPANVVCDPATSAYGAAYWETPCSRAAVPITVTATWGTHDGRPVISFSPDLRFAPSKQQRDWVELSLKDTRGIDNKQYYTILWYDRDAKRWVDESATDATLKTRTNKSGNLVIRRLKHFSDWALWSGFGGYNVTSGYGGMQ